ncbi:MAG: type II secretion system F family protein [Deltaproteobacteria bacterium]|nr:type II secretion system F family protein [Deltaproteobacteria bacterium]
MRGLTVTILILTFILVTGISMLFCLYLDRRYRRWLIAKRFFGSGVIADDLERERLKDSQWASFIKSLGIMSTPKNEHELVSIRRLLCYAGFRSPDSVTFYFGFKLGLAFLLGGIYLVILILSNNSDFRHLIFTFFPLGLGYYLPGIILKARISARADKIRRELPDALDLLLICIEAGLSFDMALFRVSKEMANVTPILSKEFSQYFLETQSGLPRKKVLKNLAERNGVNSLDSIINVLMQSTKFGTDIAEALRIYSGSLRQERQKRAEEKGARISTKLTFPLIMLIMPALLIVILGPAIINLMKNMG